MAKSTKTQSTTVTSTPRLRKTRTPAATLTTTDVSTNNVSLTHDAIAMRAYELYLASGGVPGQDVEHWLRAESELRARVVTSTN